MGNDVISKNLYSKKRCNLNMSDGTATFSPNPSLISEGATHVARSYNIRRAAFTLAEVLITLGIIGVVAAMTMPTLINKYQAKVAATRLKQTYSILSQALTAAQADYGDISGWGIQSLYGSTDVYDDDISDFMQKYIIPYVKVVKDYGIKSSTSMGLKGPYMPVSHTSQFGRGYYIALANGTLINSFMGTGCDEYNDDNECIRSSYKNIMFGVDINGSRGTNLIGKEFFLMYLDLKNNKFNMFGVGFDRTRLLETCATDLESQFCGALIQADGWEIKDDYPWW